jgi:hypothetical protein
LNNIFEFKGSFNEITLNTKYEPIQYTINAFIGAYEKDMSGNFIPLQETNSEINSLGNFAIQLDTTNLLTTTHLQWGFKIAGYPIYPSESGNQGSVIIGSTN